MEEHMKERPLKKFFSREITDNLRHKATEKVKIKLLPNSKIIKIILIGSSVKYSFGKYESPGFRGSLYSDFDFIVFVEDDYFIPEWLNKEPDGKPFSDDDLNLAYRNKNFIENKHDVEIFFVRKSTLNNLEICDLGEAAGIPMHSNSKNEHLVVYSKN
jgi:hypothetical protein